MGITRLFHLIQTKSPEAITNLKLSDLKNKIIALDSTMVYL